MKAGLPLIIIAEDGLLTGLRKPRGLRTPTRTGAQVRMTTYSDDEWHLITCKPTEIKELTSPWSLLAQPWEAARHLPAGQDSILYVQLKEKFLNW